MTHRLSCVLSIIVFQPPTVRGDTRSGSERHSASLVSAWRNARGANHPRESACGHERPAVSPLSRWNPWLARRASIARCLDSVKLATPDVRQTRPGGFSDVSRATAEPNTPQTRTPRPAWYNGFVPRWRFPLILILTRWGCLGAHGFFPLALVENAATRIASAGAALCDPSATCLHSFGRRSGGSILVRLAPRRGVRPAFSPPEPCLPIYRCLGGAFAHAVRAVSTRVHRRRGTSH